MPAYRWKKYCLKCHYRLDGVDAKQCPECGQVFDPDDEKTWSKRSYNLNDALRRRRLLVVVFVVAIILIGAGLALLFPQSAVLIVIFAALPVITILALWTMGLDVVELTQLVLPIKEPVKEEVPAIEVTLAPLVGKTGRVVVTLKPVGRVMIDGQAYEAKSEVELMEIGEKVKVVGANEWMLIVRDEND